MPIYENYREFLTDHIGPDELKPSQKDSLNWWCKKAMDRKRRLEKGGEIRNEALFYNLISDLELDSWLAVRGM